MLEVARYSYPRLGPGEYLIIKEPNGSIGASLLMEAFPESRMVLLIRDPRDVVSSVLDASKKGGWLHERWDSGASEQPGLADDNPDEFVESWAKVYRDGVGNALRAYRSHRGPKALIRYEDLVDNTYVGHEPSLLRTRHTLQHCGAGPRHKENSRGRTSPRRKKGRASSSAREGREDGGKISPWSR